MFRNTYCVTWPEHFGCFGAVFRSTRFGILTLCWNISFTSTIPTIMSNWKTMNMPQTQKKIHLEFHVIHPWHFYYTVFWNDSLQLNINDLQQQCCTQHASIIKLARKKSVDNSLRLFKVVAQIEIFGHCLNFTRRKIWLQQPLSGCLSRIYYKLRTVQHIIINGSSFQSDG